MDNDTKTETDRETATRSRTAQAGNKHPLQPSVGEWYMLLFCSIWGVVVAIYMREINEIVIIAIVTMLFVTCIVLTLLN